jgi:hypothetical protein
MPKSHDQVLAEAKRFLKKRHVVDQPEGAADAAAAKEQARLEKESSWWGQVKSNPGRFIGESADGSMLPLSLLGGPLAPLGAAAAIGNTAQTAVRTAQDPTLANGAMLGIEAAAPFISKGWNAAKGLWKGRKGGAAIGEFDKYMPNTSAPAPKIPKPTKTRTGAAAGPTPQPTPYSGGAERITYTTPSSGAVGPSPATASPSIRALAEQPVEIDRYMPNIPPGGGRQAMAAEGEDAALQRFLDSFDTGGISQVDEGATALNASGDSAASLEALSRASGMGRRGEQFVVYDRAGNMRKLIGPEAVDYTPRPGETYGVQGPTGFKVLDDLGGKVGSPGAASPEVRAAGRSQRVDALTADAVAKHQATRAHGVAGFSDLPQPSLAELARMSRNISATGAGRTNWKGN